MKRGSRSQTNDLKSFSPRETLTTPRDERGSSATQLRPLSSMFCEKMDLSLSSAVLESGVVPLSIYNTLNEAWTGHQLQSDFQRQNSTFLTDTSNFENDETTKLEFNIDLPREEEQDSTGVGPDGTDIWNTGTENDSNFYMNVLEPMNVQKTLASQQSNAMEAAQNPDFDYDNAQIVLSDKLQGDRYVSVSLTLTYI